ncbi:MAG TPA: CrcB family protein, partial [Bacilli bacterium]
MMLWNVCLVGLGGFFGAISRSYIGNLIGIRFSSAFPYGTLTINLSGSFLLGLLFGIFQGT